MQNGGIRAIATSPSRRQNQPFLHTQTVMCVFGARVGVGAWLYRAIPPKKVVLRGPAPPAPQVSWLT